MKAAAISPKKHRQGGFTLVELLVATAVAGIIIIIVMGFTANYLKNSSIQEARDTLLSDAQLGLERVNQAIRLSADADDTNRWPDNNGPGGNQLGWQSTGDTLVLATAAQDSSGNIIFQDPLHYVTAKDNYIYFVSNGTLYRRLLAAPVSGNAAATSCPAAKATSSCPADNTLMQNVSSFSVTYIDGNGDVASDPANARAIQLSVSLSEVKYNTPISVSYTTRTVFRND
jgi:prepilin-type N-terminal cleavage/methylation domain-containing protein